MLMEQYLVRPIETGKILTTDTFTFLLHEIYICQTLLSIIVINLLEYHKRVISI